MKRANTSGSGKMLVEVQRGGLVESQRKIAARSGAQEQHVYAQLVKTRGACPSVMLTKKRTIAGFWLFDPFELAAQLRLSS